MCLALIQLPGVAPLSGEKINNAWSHNDDGAGYMFCHNGKLEIRKPFFTLKGFKRAYRLDHAQYGQSSPFVIHFRWATHGARDEVNTHPHTLCGERAGLVHNGVLPFDPPPKSTISDTVYFCQTVMAYRCMEHLTDDAFAEILADIIGPNNKLIIMDETGKFSIVNEAAGKWDGGTWYSNNTHSYPYRKPLPVCTSSIGCSNWQLAYHARQAAAKITGTGTGTESASGRPEEWEEIPESVPFQLTDSEIAEFRAEYDLLEQKAIGEGLSIDEWDRYETICDILDEHIGGESEADKQRREWDEWARENNARANGEDINGKLDKAMDAAIAGDKI